MYVSVCVALRREFDIIVYEPVAAWVAKFNENQFVSLTQLLKK